MSDLIERLRCVRSIRREINPSHICEEAADEIERLEARVDELEGAISGGIPSEMQEALATLKGEDDG